jgi:hypothetical protein
MWRLAQGAGIRSAARSSALATSGAARRTVTQKGRHGGLVAEKHSRRRCASLRPSPLGCSHGGIAAADHSFAHEGSYLGRRPDACLGRTSCVSHPRGRAIASPSESEGLRRRTRRLVVVRPEQQRDRSGAGSCSHQGNTCVASCLPRIQGCPVPSRAMSRAANAGRAPWQRRGAAASTRNADLKRPLGVALFLAAWQQRFEALCRRRLPRR